MSWGWGAWLVNAGMTVGRIRRDGPISLTRSDLQEEMAILEFRLWSISNYAMRPPSPSRSCGEEEMLGSFKPLLEIAMIDDDCTILHPPFSTQMGSESRDVEVGQVGGEHVGLDSSVTESVAGRAVGRTAVMAESSGPKVISLSWDGNCGTLDSN